MKAKVEKYVDILKQNNIRMTSQRYAILEYLIIKETHPTANEIFNDLRKDFSNMSIATVYNNLNFFKEAGILKELQFKDQSSRFDLSNEPHYHAVCKNCGKIIDFDFQELRNFLKEVEKITDFEINEHEFNVSGLCSDCKNKKNV